MVLPAFFLIALYNLSSAFFVRMFPGLLGLGVNNTLDGIALWVLGVGYFAAGWGYMAADIYLDFLVLFMLVLLFVAVRRSFSTTRAVQVDSLMVLILTVEIFLTDYVDFNLHVTNFQAHFNFVPWFSNADLLMVASSVLALSFVYPRLGLRLRRALSRA